MHLKYKDYELEVEFDARTKWKPKLTGHGQFSYSKPLYWMFTFGKLFVLFGRPGLIEVEVCNWCDEEVHGMGEDGISYCEGCGCVEGDTRIITESEYEKLHA